MPLDIPRSNMGSNDVTFTPMGLALCSIFEIKVHNIVQI